jgi:hypothetical protein
VVSDDVEPRTKARGEQLCVEVRQELLVLRIELPHSCHDVARQTHAHNLHDGLEDQQCKVGKVGVRAVLVPEDAHVAVAGVVERLSTHSDEVWGVEVGGAHAKGLRSREERHSGIAVVCRSMEGAGG